LREETDWTQPKAVENFLKFLDEKHRNAIMNHYINMMDSWKKIATMVTDIWFSCPNLEVGKRLKTEGGNVYFYCLSFADNTLADMPLGIIVFSFNFFFGQILRTLTSWLFKSLFVQCLTPQKISQF
jgi:hypothetical protein